MQSLSHLVVPVLWDMLTSEYDEHAIMLVETLLHFTCFDMGLREYNTGRKGLT